MKEDKLMAHDPLSDADAILSEEYYGRRRDGAASRRAAQAARSRRRRPARPTHYKVICISMYTRDLEDLDAKVAELKRRGWTKANKSQLIRLALSADRSRQAADAAPVAVAESDQGPRRAHHRWSAGADYFFFLAATGALAPDLNSLPAAGFFAAAFAAPGALAPDFD